MIACTRSCCRRMLSATATARAIWIHSRGEDAYFFKDSAWYTGFVGGNHEFLKNGGAGGHNLDARVLFHYMATVITPAMVEKMVGPGSQYALLNLDKNGEYMDGSKTYRLTCRQWNSGP